MLASHTKPPNLAASWLSGLSSTGLRSGSASIGDFWAHLGNSYATRVGHSHSMRLLRDGPVQLRNRRRIP